MYTDQAYLVKDRFHEKSKRKSLSTLYRYPSLHDKGSVADPDLFPISYGGKVIPHCPPGLENLYSLNKVYLIKRLEMFQDDVFNDYKGELIDEHGNRIFLITSAAHHTSDEVIHYGKHKSVKYKGKVNYGALNYKGIQLFEIHGDPEKVIRVGPNSGLWGEIQVIPGDMWNRVHINCCCIRIGQKSSGEAEIRVVVLKKDNRAMTAVEGKPNDIFKQVYTLRGKISTGCHNQSQQNFLYKKTFDLNIYIHDPFEPEKPQEAPAPKKEEEEDSEEDSSEEEDSDDDDDDEEDPSKKGPKEVKPVKVKEPKQKPQKKRKSILPAPAGPAGTTPKNTEPIGRICSQALHETLGMHLPILEFPRNISVYDKLTLMGTFFLFNLKI